jgi:serine protease AprX
MRVCITDKGLGLARIESEVISLGAKDIKKAERAGMLFCDLDPAAVERLKSVPDIVVRPVKKTTVSQVIAPPAQAATIEIPVYSALQASLASKFWDFRNMFDPPVLGTGLTVAVVDTGVRKTHVGLKDKVVYEVNFTDSPSSDDIFSHGTGVAYLIAGGEHGLSKECGIAPGAKIMNIKVIGDDGVGTEEWLILGLDECRRIVDEAKASGLSYFDPMYLNAVNCSVGATDDGDPDNPVREAIERLYGTPPDDVPIFCSAGNTGPDVRTIELPAAARHAWAVGAVTFEPFEIWEKSSRGVVTLTDGTQIMKPEFVFYGVNILTAGARSDEDFQVKSGTSFASPMALGAFILFREAAYRAGLLEAYEAMSYEQEEVLVQFLTIKPPETALGKDNFYGYGMPFGDLMARAVPVYPTTTIDWVYGIMGMVVPLAMVGALVKGVK